MGGAAYGSQVKFFHVVTFAFFVRGAGFGDREGISLEVFCRRGEVFDWRSGTWFLMSGGDFLVDGGGGSGTVGEAAHFVIRVMVFVGWFFGYFGADD